MIQKAIVAVVTLVVLVAVGLGILVWRRPMEVFAWSNRRALIGAGFVKSTIDTPVGRQTIFSAGAGPSLLFLHGAGDHAGAWAKVAPAFTSDYRVIIPDLAGHGESGPESGPLGVGTMLSGVETIAAVQSGKVVMVGNSLGAWVATLYARKHPDKVGRLVLVNGGPLAGTRKDLTLTPHNREEARRLLEALTDPGSAHIPDFVVDDMVRQAQTGPLMRISQTSSEMPQYLLEGRLRELTVPVDLLWGESDRMLPLEYARRMQSQLPASQLTSLGRCGHAPQMECPKQFTARLKEVLQSPAPKMREPMGVQAQ
jgi:pimeloyl-ACP methyl ester carboxylesterase